jgi:2-keto-4-pentenoate hydratase/2-oxohepta-3-ene-1,7-dioic acid hydratase in catechol pathway
VLLARASIDGAPQFGEIEGETFHLLRGDPLEGAQRSGETAALGDVRLEAPIVPRRIFVVLGGFLPEDTPVRRPGSVPRLFPKIASSVSGPEGDIVVPTWATSVWGEVELALVIGRRLHGVDREEARRAILGYTCFNDVTAPELAEGANYFPAKSIDTFASMGPWITTDLTEDMISDGLQIVARVDGSEVANGNTKLFKFAPSEVVSWLSTYVTLLPGDVISLGTPPPAVELAAGNVFELDVENVGVLRNRVVGDPASPE